MYTNTDENETAQILFAYAPQFTKISCFVCELIITVTVIKCSKTLTYPLQYSS